MKISTKLLFVLSLVPFGVALGVTSTIEETVQTTQTAHGLEAWWGKEVVSAQVEIVFGGNVALNGVFLFEAHGPKARFDRADGATVYFDGKTAWIYPADAPDNRGRFHVLTWSWFIMAPFKMQGEGIYLTELETKQVGEQTYHTLLQTFGKEVGDTPDDWYRFFIHPETHLIDAMSYIVTYGKDLAKANEEASIIKYFDYKSFEGPVISTRYEFWYWDAETVATVGDEPKGTGTVRQIEYPKKSEVSFEVPEGARELKMP
jgi:hypothetical protein